MNRRRFLALGFAAVVTSRVDLPDWFGEVAARPIPVTNLFDEQLAMNELMKSVFEDAIVKSIMTETPIVASDLFPRGDVITVDPTPARYFEFPISL